MAGTQMDSYIFVQCFFHVLCLHYSSIHPQDVSPSSEEALVQLSKLFLLIIKRLAEEDIQTVSVCNKMQYKEQSKVLNSSFAIFAPFIYIFGFHIPPTYF